MSEEEFYHEIYYENSKEDGDTIMDNTRCVLSTMDVGDVFTFTRVVNKWDEVISLPYFRTVVSKCGKESGKKFTVKKLDSSWKNGYKVLAKVKRLK
jgi:ribosome biogenesis protein Tsr3